jgi:hypothetical protein
MGRYLTTSIIVIVCFAFFLSVELGLIPGYIVNAIPSAVWGWLLLFSIIVLVLVGIGILPSSNKTNSKIRILYHNS